VLISSGVILYIYSTIMTVLRLALDDSTASIPGVKSSVSTIALPPYVSAMFAGMVIEVIFLVSFFTQSNIIHIHNYYIKYIHNEVYNSSIQITMYWTMLYC
jgi:hypothetical protein